FVDQKADGHDGEAIAADRLEAGAADGLRLFTDRQQLRQRWAVDVSIEHADLEAEIAQAEREIDGRRRFADAAFAGGDGNHGLDARNAGGRIVGRMRGAMLRPWWRLLR